MTRSSSKSIRGEKAGWKWRKFYVDVLSKLTENLEGTWANEWKQVYEEAASRFARHGVYIGKRQVEQFLDACRPNLYPVLLLPPIPKHPDFCPCLHVSSLEPCKGKPDEWCCRLYVLFVHFEGNTTDSDFAFRIESPESYFEGSATPGSHDFYHAQLVRTFPKESNKLNTPLLPDHQPSFALLAHNVAEALLNVVIALYGKERLREIIRQLPRNEPILVTQHFRETLLWNPE